MSDSENPSDIEEQASKAISELVPQKSKQKYEYTYNNYVKWFEEKKTHNYAIEKVLITYFSNLSQNVKRHGSWRSNTVAEGYIENSRENKRKTARKSLGDTGSTAEATFSTNNGQLSQDAYVVTVNTTKPRSTTSEINLNQCQNCTINIYSKKIFGVFIVTMELKTSGLRKTSVLMNLLEYSNECFNRPS